MPGRREVLQYFAQEKEYMETRVNEGIEKYRKGDFSISFVDKKEKPVKDVTVRAELTNHAFNFGANLFQLDTLIDYQHEDYEKGLFKEGFDLNELADYKERNAKYKELFKEMFNFATVPFYWNAVEPEQDKPRYDIDAPHIHRRPTPSSCVKFCKENGIRMKAHCLNYNGSEPKWVQKIENAEEVKRLLDKRFKECAERYAEDIPGWEVTNETLVLYPQPGGTSAFFPKKEFVEWSFKDARKYFKNNELIINDNHETVWQYYIGYRSAYYMQIEQELAKGTPIDTIGMQFHVFYDRDVEPVMAAKFYNPRFLYEVMDRYSDFDKPLQITEITIPAYSNEPEDEAIQAEILKNLYSIWFSHPNMEAIVYWNLAEGYLGPIADMAVGENRFYGGFTRFDFSKKPAYDVLYDLIHKQWHTCVQAETGNTNEMQFRGFYGNYDLEITVNGKTVHKNISTDKKRNNHFMIVL